MTRSINTHIVCASLLVIISVAAFAFAAPAHAQTVGGPIPLCEIQRNLTIGASGEDVRCLQKYLNWSGFPVASAGAGAPGSETQYFGPLTASALARWQNAHSAVVLTPLNIPQGTGYWGFSSFGHYVGIVRIALGL